MFLIFGTDAPLYHYPIVTVGMVVLNVVVHWLIVATGFDASPYYLYFGDGLHPLQWVTHNFLHGGPLAGWPHLIFNMIFLWPFGMIVEGKIGWARMLVLYMAVGTAQGFTQQLIMLPSDPKNYAAELVELLNDPEKPMPEEDRQALMEQFRRDLLRTGSCSLGSSAVIFGLIAICAIWAPENEFESYFRWGLFIPAPDGGIREWTVLTVALMFVAKEVGLFVIQNGALSSAALHLNGFVVGGAIGLGMLYFGYVDCEGFDLISHVTGEKFKSERIRKLEQKEELAAREAAKPKGPPQAVVPVMPHVLAQQVASRSSSAGRDRSRTPPPHPSLRSETFDAAPAMPVSETGVPNDGIASDPTLPEFDDTVAKPDPESSVRNGIETAIAQGRFAAAVKQFATQRKKQPDFMLSAVAIGNLSEGLIRQRHIPAALKTLALGCQAYPAYAPRWRIRAASIELKANHNPMAAIKLLKKVDKEMLDRNTREHFLRVAEQARRMADG